MDILHYFCNLNINISKENIKEKRQTYSYTHIPFLLSLPPPAEGGDIGKIVTDLSCFTAGISTVL